MGKAFSKPVDYIKGKTRTKDSGDQSPTLSSAKRPLDTAQHPTEVSSRVDPKALTSRQALAVRTSREVLGKKPEGVEGGESAQRKAIHDEEMRHDHRISTISQDYQRKYAELAEDKQRQYKALEDKERKLLQDPSNTHRAIFQTIAPEATALNEHFQQRERKLVEEAQALTKIEEEEHQRRLREIG